MFKNPVYNIISKDDLSDLKKEIQIFESKTGCELKICIRYKRGIHQKKFTLRELSVKEFRKLGVYKTKSRKGILIYLLMYERKFDILPDIGFKDIIPDTKWKEYSEKFKQYFRDGKFKNGFIHIIDDLKNILSEYHSQDGNTPNELNDDIVIE
jgi:uncharacterized membrane protein